MRFRNKTLIPYIFILYITLLALGWFALDIIIRQTRSLSENRMKAEADKIIFYLSSQEENMLIIHTAFVEFWNLYGKLPVDRKGSNFSYRLIPRNSPSDTIYDKGQVLRWDLGEIKDIIYLVLTIQSRLQHPETGELFDLEIEKKIFLHLSGWIQEMMSSNLEIFSSQGKFLGSTNRADNRSLKQEEKEGDYLISIPDDALSSITNGDNFYIKRLKKPQEDEPISMYYFPILTKKNKINYIIGLEYPMGLRDKILKSLVMLTLAILSAVTLILASMYYYATMRINNYFNHLIHFTRRVAEGDFFLRLEDKGGDDFSELNESLNQMASSLEQMKAYEQEFLVLDRLTSLAHLSEGIAHEIKNPLMVLKYSANDIIRHISEDKLKEDLAMMVRNIDRIESVVQRLADFSRPSESEDVGHYNLISILEETLYFLKKTFSNNEIEIVKNYGAEEIQATVMKSAIFQVFTNVLLNALEAMGQGGTVTISVTIKDENPDKKYAIFSIQDTGEGIPQKNHDKIFNPFFTTKDKGTGLGLAIVYRIMIEHNGFIDISSPSSAAQENSNGTESKEMLENASSSESATGTTILLGFNLSNVGLSINPK